ncbi:MAG: glycosyltransferase family 39 protein [Chloroflexi bacterium]|nr:glycosyltransferase family 39 protein [Chloroflexota bacterium]
MQWIIAQTANKPTAILLAGIILLGFFLRIFLLDGQSLWYDEGSSVALAFRDPATIAQNAAQDIHPPLYYLLLHYWVGFFGSSELALRALSVLAGTLLVAVTFLLGKEMFSPQVGIFAAFLAAISPFQIYYSQETRMYILVTLWGALTVYFFWRFITYWKAPTATTSNPVRNLVLYSTFSLLALYTHYFAFTIILLSNLAFLFLWVRARTNRPLRPWVVGQAAIILLYLPWLLFAGGQLFSWPAVSEQFPLTFLAGEVLRLFSVGPTSGFEPQLLFAFFFGLLLLGLFGQPNDKIGSKILTLLYLAVPPLAMYLLSLDRPLFRPKFLLMATPGFHLLLAYGLSGEWLPLRWPVGMQKLLSAILTAGVILATVPSLSNYYFDENYARDDYRGLASYITTNGQVGDAILLNAPTQVEIFSYYYKGPLPLYPLPQSRPLQEGKTEKSLQEVTDQYQRLFAIFWATEESDPQRFIEGWLDRQAFKAWEEWYGGVRLVLYALPSQPISAQIQNPRSIRLGDQILFLGYNLYNPRVEAGGILQFTFFWQTTEKIGERYKVFIHLLDEHEQVIAQRDAEPVGGAMLTTTWMPEEPVIDNHGILIPVGTPPGEYRVEVGMYNLSTGERLVVTEGGETGDNRFFLPAIRVF